jgi:hypothetical protein
MLTRTYSTNRKCSCRKHNGKKSDTEPSHAMLAAPPPTALVTGWLLPGAEQLTPSRRSYKSRSHDTLRSTDSIPRCLLTRNNTDLFDRQDPRTVRRIQLVVGSRCTSRYVAEIRPGLRATQPFLQRWPPGEYSRSSLVLA